MKRIIIKTASVLLTFVLLMLALSSCNLDVSGNWGGGTTGGMNGNHPDWHFFPEGYTCGFPRLINLPAPRLEFWWVETYEECLEAIELLKSHGSTFCESTIFTYDGDLFDTKYCFKISRESLYTDDIDFGDNPFDRRAGGVEISSYAFLDDVTIDEINHGNIKDYRVYSAGKAYAFDSSFSIESLRCEWDESAGHYYAYDLSQENSREPYPKPYFSIGSFDYNNDPIYSQQCALAVLNSIEFIDEDFNPDLYPTGYTGGFGIQEGLPTEYWWVETYEECLAAIELLKSHESTFKGSVFFKYDGELFDTKYCIAIPVANKDTQRINFGDDPFDRYAQDVRITSYAFFEDVSIDELNYSYVRELDVYTVRTNAGFLRIYGKPFISPDDLKYEWNEASQSYEICLALNGETAEEEPWFTIESLSAEKQHKPEQYVGAIVESLRIIEYGESD